MRGSYKYESERESCHNCTGEPRLGWAVWGQVVRSLPPVLSRSTGEQAASPSLAWAFPEPVLTPVAVGRDLLGTQEL